jgi:hypothetical protein
MAAVAKVSPAGAILLLLEAAVADFAKTVEEHGSGKRFVLLIICHILVRIIWQHSFLTCPVGTQRAPESSYVGEILPSHTTSRPIRMQCAK